MAFGSLRSLIAKVSARLVALGFMATSLTDLPALRGQVLLPE